ncbi:uncharacterized protein ARMOST_07964 [Armillaria ostoyae]|uniref:F-box domain-containing protein n=1 Tax=Armillaria ostoyae TaxID=47428 RepID=A0A284R7A4_ARMOS|nr:uncharacterized protein ARMOST_07964 [Armillaria ostoyae]
MLNELLLLISAELGIKDIAFLGSMCHHLNHVILSEFITSTHLSFEHLQSESLEPTTELTHPFSALQLPLLCLENTPVIPTITLSFSSDFMTEVMLVSCFMQLISYVPSLRISFKEIIFMLPEGNTGTGTCVFDNFWQLCKRLSTWDCCSLILGYDVEGLENVLSSSHRHFLPSPFRSLLALSIPPQPPKMLDWVVLSMNESPVQLVIMDGTFEPTLSRLTLPALYSLTCIYIDTIGGMTVDMITFLGHHPSITSIHLDGDYFRQQDRQLVSRELWPLPHLYSLAAMINMLYIMLSIPSLFPLMHEICVNGPIINSRLGTTKECFLLLSSVLMLVSSTPAVQSLALPFLNHFDGDAWNSFTLPGCRPESFLTKITKVTMYDGSPTFLTLDGWDPFNMIETISRFPSLRVLEVDGSAFSVKMGFSPGEEKWELVFEAWISSLTFCIWSTLWKNIRLWLPLFLLSVEKFE